MTFFWQAEFIQLGNSLSPRVFFWNPFMSLVSSRELAFSPTYASGLAPLVNLRLAKRGRSHHFEGIPSCQIASRNDSPWEVIPLLGSSALCSDVGGTAICSFQCCQVPPRSLFLFAPSSVVAEEHRLCALPLFICRALRCFPLTMDVLWTNILAFIPDTYLSQPDFCHFFCLLVSSFLAVCC